MPATSWIEELDRWLKRVGMSYRDIARKSKHDPAYVALLFTDGGPTPGLTLYLDLVRESGGCLDLVVASTSSAVCEKLREEAESQGVGKAQLGRAVKRPRSSISRLLNGRNPNPNLKLIADLTDQLGLAGRVKIGLAGRVKINRFHPGDVQAGQVEELVPQEAGSRYSYGPYGNLNRLLAQAAGQCGSCDFALQHDGVLRIAWERSDPSDAELKFRCLQDDTQVLRQWKLTVSDAPALETSFAVRPGGIPLLGTQVVFHDGGDFLWRIQILTSLGCAQYERVRLERALCRPLLLPRACYTPQVRRLRPDGGLFPHAVTTLLEEVIEPAPLADPIGELRKTLASMPKDGGPY